MVTALVRHQAQEMKRGWMIREMPQDLSVSLFSFSKLARFMVRSGTLVYLTKLFWAHPLGGEKVSSPIPISRQASADDKRSRLHLEGAI